MTFIKSLNISRENVNQCPCCGNEKYGKSFNDYHGISYYVCQQCKSIYQNPKINDTYDDSYWKDSKGPDGNKRDLTNERDFKVKNWYGDAASVVNGMKGGRILDAGAGLGYFLSSIGKNWDKHALDSSEFAVQFMRDNYSEIKVQQGTLKSVSFPEHYFDVIMLYHVIEHLSDPSEVLEIISRILKPKGTLIVGTPNIASPAAKIFKGNFRLYGPGHACLFNPQSLKKLLSNHSYRVQRIEYPFFKTDYANLSSMLRMCQPCKISPPFWGSIMTIYAVKDEDSF